MILKQLTIASISLFTFVACAQQEQKAQKEIRMEDENGEKTLYITTTSANEVTEEVYKGEAAEEKLQEIMADDIAGDKMKKEIEVLKENGQTKVVIRTIEGGKITEEEYIGEEADKKLKELENAEHHQGEVREIQIIEKEIKE